MFPFQLKEIRNHSDVKPHQLVFTGTSWRAELVQMNTSSRDTIRGRQLYLHWYNTLGLYDSLPTENTVN